MEKEEWRYIVDYEGLYQVSNYGRIKSLARKTNNQFGKEDRILSPGWFNNSGGKKYLFVYLCKDGKHKKHSIHRLVAFAFPEICGEWFEGAVCNHRDENPENNCAWNLEWCTQKHNINFGTRNEKVAAKLEIPVVQYTKDGEYVAWYPSAVKAEEATNISSQNISRCRAGSLPSAGGFVWRYD